MLTVADFINLIQYYYTHSSVEDAFREIESFELAHLRNVEKLVGAPAPQLVSMDPMATLYDACRMLAESRVHRVPLLDIEPETGTEMIVSVITQYRILKFIASNVSEMIYRGRLFFKKYGCYISFNIQRFYANLYLNSKLVPLIILLQHP